MSPTTPLRAAIYTRVSSEEQAQEGTSLDVQRERALAYCHAQGWAVVDVFTDAGVSGALPQQQRPALQALLAAVKAGGVDRVVVVKVDRLARSMRHLAPLLGDLDDLDVALVSIAEAFDSASPAGRLMRNMLGSMAEWERDVIRERTTSGRMARLAQGGWTGGEPPYGFRVDRSGDFPRLALDDAETSTIRYAVHLLLDQGKGPLAVVNALNTEGRLPRKAPRWTLTLLRNHLLNGPWGGTWTYGKPSARVKAEPVTIAVPRVLEPERHARLLEHLKATTVRRTDGPVHPLSGLLTGPCGHTYHGVARRDRGRRRYRCKYAKDTGRGWTCDAPSVVADSLDWLVWGRVLGLLADPDSLRAAATDRLDLLATTTETVAEALDRAKAEEARCQQALADAFAGALKAGLDAETVDLTLAALKADLAACRARVADLAAMAAGEQQATDRAQAVQALADLAGDRLANADAQTQADVLRLLRLAVTFTADDVDSRGFVRGIQFMGSVAHDLLLAYLTPSDCHPVNGATCRR